MGDTKPKHGARNIVEHCPIDTAVVNEIKRRNPTINFDKTEGAIENLKRACGPSLPGTSFIPRKTECGGQINWRR